ncbi:hypothetical protein HYH02_011324 [Chlamydomonas schloesseri]|uniref:Protein kinase domain-containing protein n=1 Tax=Chlamydomonas schloesseri TaxID=2026947 RepID=A0A835T1E2_9CHLO|nr:hypothetical protein HYH02_011324 [Chlamydomonas schloesseri]|eukprot:KAG2437064.1 hypothetical protein HYH02_011324 [Chlamydomonas schloesseri]
MKGLCINLVVYSSDGAFAVVIHSAGPEAQHLQAGSVELNCFGSSHWTIFEDQRPLLHCPTAPLHPLPSDWQTLLSYSDTQTLMLLPLRRPVLAGAEATETSTLFGALLVAVPPPPPGRAHTDPGLRFPVASGGALPEPLGPDTVYDTDDLDQLSQVLSIGLMTNAVDGAVLQLVADTAAYMGCRAANVQDAMCGLVEGVAAALRLTTRLDLEVLPVVAFRAHSVAAYFRMTRDPASAAGGAGAGGGMGSQGAPGAGGGGGGAVNSGGGPGAAGSSGADSANLGMVARQPSTHVSSRATSRSQAVRWLAEEQQQQQQHVAAPGFLGVGSGGGVASGPLPGGGVGGGMGGAAVSPLHSTVSMHGGLVAGVSRGASGVGASETEAGAADGGGRLPSSSAAGGMGGGRSGMNVGSSAPAPGRALKSSLMGLLSGPARRDSHEGVPVPGLSTHGVSGGANSPRCVAAATAAAIANHSNHGAGISGAHAGSSTQGTSIQLPLLGGGGGASGSGAGFGGRVRASAAPLTQTLLGQQLDMAAAAGLHGPEKSSSQVVVSTSGTSALLPGGHRPTAAAALLAASMSNGGGPVGGRARGASRAGSVEMLGLSGVSPDAASRRHLYAAIVPNCSTFLMADERQPYRDVLYVQRLLPQARAHSLVLLLAGAVGTSRQQSAAQHHLQHTQSLSRHPTTGGGGGSSCAAAGGATAPPAPLPGSSSCRPGSSTMGLTPVSATASGVGASSPSGIRHPNVELLSADEVTTESFRALGSEPPGGEAKDRVMGGVAGAPAASSLLASNAIANAAGGSQHGRTPAAPHRGSGVVEVVAVSGPAPYLQYGAGGGAGMAPAAAAAAGALALYLVASESVPQSILEQVAEDARQIMQVLHRTLCWVLTGPTLGTEWMRLCQLVVSKSAAGTLGGGGSAAGLGRPPSLLANPGAGGSGMSASNANDASAASAAAGAGGGGGTGTGVGKDRTGQSSFLLRSTQTHLSEDLDDLAGVSVAFDTATATDGGTSILGMMINSMRDVLSTIQLDRCPDFRSPSQEDIYAVRLFKVIGRGGQGMVFQGQLYNTVVAVKVIPSAEDPTTAEATADGAAGTAGGSAAAAGGSGAGANGAGPEGAAAEAAAAAKAADAAKQQQRHKRWLVRDALEVAVTTTLSHPSIVQVLNFFTDALVVEYSNEHGRYRLLPREDNPTAKGSTNTAIVMEYCDAGTLKHAVDGGCFRLKTPSGATATGAGGSFGGSAAGGQQPGGGGGGAAGNASGALDLVSLLTSLLEVAAALRHMHENRLVHCDIKPSNVLLKSSASDTRGWVCKLSDFGCVRLLNDTDPATGRPAFHALSPVGSLSYMSPESMFRDVMLDASIDIYAFGILMWECAMAQLPYTGVPAAQLPNLVRRGLRPSFHPRVPPEYRQLAVACWAHEPRRRPSAAAVVQLLQRMLSSAFEETLNTSPSTATGAAVRHAYSDASHGPSPGANSAAAAAALRQNAMSSASAVGPGGGSAAGLGGGGSLTRSKAAAAQALLPRSPSGQSAATMVTPSAVGAAAAAAAAAASSAGGGAGSVHGGTGSHSQLPSVAEVQRSAGGGGQPHSAPTSGGNLAALQRLQAPLPPPSQGGSGASSAVDASGDSQVAAGGNNASDSGAHTTDPMPPVSAGGGSAHGAGGSGGGAAAAALALSPIMPTSDAGVGIPGPSATAGTAATAAVAATAAASASAAAAGAARHTGLPALPQSASGRWSRLQQVSHATDPPSAAAAGAAASSAASSAAEGGGVVTRPAAGAAAAPKSSGRSQQQEQGQQRSDAVDVGAIELTDS